MANASLGAEGYGSEILGLTLHCLDATEIADIKAKVESTHGCVTAHHILVKLRNFAVICAFVWKDGFVLERRLRPVLPAAQLG